MALYDPNEFPAEAETSADFPLAEFLAWARTMPVDDIYDYFDSRVCALAQFGLATGRTELVGPSGTAVLDGWPALRDAVCGPDEDTFGRLVKHLEAML